MERVTDIRQIRVGSEVLFAEKIVHLRRETSRHYCPHTAALHDEAPIGRLRRSTVREVDRENNVVRVDLRRERVPLSRIWAVERYPC